MAAARIVGIATTRIVIWPLGGFALVAQTYRWRKQLPIAAGGPAVNLLLGLILLFTSYTFRYPAGLWTLTWHLFVINLVMLVFNLLPIWPLDGGRILVAILHAFLGIVRGRLAAHALGIALAAILSPLVLYLHVFDLGTILMLATVANVVGMRWPLGMWVSERHVGFHEVARCPHCGSRALRGTTGECPNCFVPCNLLDNGACWNCHTTSPIVCRYCRESEDYAMWVRADTASTRVAGTPVISKTR